MQTPGFIEGVKSLHFLFWQPFLSARIGICICKSHSWATPTDTLINCNPSGYAVFRTSLNIDCIHFRKIAKKSSLITGKESWVWNSESETLLLIDLSHHLLSPNKGYIYTAGYWVLVRQQWRGIFQLLFSSRNLNVWPDLGSDITVPFGPFPKLVWMLISVQMLKILGDRLNHFWILYSNGDSENWAVWFMDLER